MGTQPGLRSLQWTRWLLVGNGVLWIGLAAASVARPESDAGLPALVIPMMLGNAAIMLVLARWLRGASALGQVTAAAWVTLNLVLSVTDQLGVWDLLVAVLNAATLVLMGAAWKALRAGSPSA